MDQKAFNVNFHKGLNTKDSPKKLQDGECQIAQDCNFDQEGTVFSRNWNLIYYEFSSPVKTIFPYRTPSTNLIIHLKNGALYADEIEIGTGYGSVPFSCIEYNGVWNGVNRSNQVRYDGDNLHDMGNTAPSAAVVVADSGDSGNPDGTYYYKVTYTDSNGKESSASPVSSAVTVVTNKVSVSLVASSVSKVSYINIYRMGGTLTDYYLVSQEANTTAAYTDDTADASLATLFDAANNDAPPNLYFLIEHYQRAIGARTSTYPHSIWWTREYDVEYWGSGTDYQYLLGGKDECTGLISWGRYVPFFKKHQIYMMEGTDPSEWHKRRSNSAKGNISPYALDFWKIPIFCSYDGLYTFNGDLSDKFSSKIDPFFTGDNKARLPDAVGKVYNNKYYFGLDNGVTLIADLLNKRFYTANFGLTAIEYDHYRDFLFGGVGDDIVKLEQTTNDDNESVDFQLKSKAYPLHDIEGMYGELQKYLIQIDTQGEDVDFKVYIDSTLKQTITLNTNSLERKLGSFGGYKGMYAEFEFVYSGTKKIQIDMPIVINPKDT